MSQDEKAQDAVQRLMDEAIAAGAEYDSPHQFAWDSYRRAERAEAYVERLREENRSLVQTIRRVLRAEPVTET